MGIQAFFFRHARSILVCAAFSFGGLLLMGLPGMVLFEAYDFLIEQWIAGPRGWARPHGDTFWPTAILYTILLPWLSWGLSLIVKRFFQRAVVFWSVWILAFSGVFFLIHLLYRAPNG